METLTFEFPAGQPSQGKALVGCVGPGDLEELLEPGEAATHTFNVVTPVNGSAARWQSHDFGATPGVVRLRLEQGLEELQLEGARHD